MEVYLIRHTTPQLSPGLIYGQTDLPVADGFEEEWTRIREQLPSSFDAVYTSPAQRCVVLAERIAEVYFSDSRLWELNFGDWEGKTWDTIDQNDLKTWADNFVHASVPGGESMIRMQERVASFWTELSEKPYTRIALVTHAGVIRLILSRIHSLPLDALFDIKVSYGEVFREDVI